MRADGAVQQGTFTGLEGLSSGSTFRTLTDSVRWFLYTASLSSDSSLLWHGSMLDAYGSCQGVQQEQLCKRQRSVPSSPSCSRTSFKGLTSKTIPDLTVSTNGHQPPTILQFGANVPLELARASSLAAPLVNGVDLNCGCPQSWACAETLGAALMNKRELVRDMVVETRQRLREDGWAVGLDADVDSPKGRSVSVKIRVHDDLRRTMDFLDTVIGHPQNRNVDWVTIHPRTRSTPSTTPIRNDALDILASKYAKTLPILLSGDVFDVNSLPFQPPSSSSASLPSELQTLTLNDMLSPKATPTTTSEWRPTPQTTNIAGFMSARGLLANPTLFAGHRTCSWEAVERFLCNVARAPLPFKLTVHHVQQMCAPGMGVDKTALLSKKERAGLGEAKNMIELIDFLDEKIEEHTGRTGGMRRDF